MYLVCQQLFLTFCTLVTLNYAKEVPLTQKQAGHISDSAPLLDDPQQNGFDLSKSKTNEQSVDNASEKRSGGGYEAVSNLKHENGNVEGDQVESFNDSPGAVLVNLLTSLRHLPPAMHSVLIVMALTWVRATFLCMPNIISELFVLANQSFILYCFEFIFLFLMFSAIICTCSCPGFHFSSSIQIGWGEKFFMGTQKGTYLKLKLMIKVSEKVHLVCY